MMLITQEVRERAARPKPPPPRAARSAGARLAVALFLLCGLPSSTWAEPPPAAALRARKLEGSGLWQAERGLPRASQRWSVTALRSEGDKLLGRLRVVGSPLFTEANLEGRLDGHRLHGVLLDDHGKALAHFEGEITRQGISGTYTDRTGERGQWVWQGKLPELE